MKICNEYFYVNHFSQYYRKEKNIFMNIFMLLLIFFTLLHITRYDNFRVTEILVGLSGDLRRYLNILIHVTKHKLFNFIK